MKPRLLGGVEAGGTKMVCAVAWSPDEVLLEERFETTTPAETLSRVESFFRKCEREHGELASIGYGTFGPANVNPLSPKYGTILPTPKEHWEGTDLLGFLQGAFPKAELAIDTDVNAAALGEGFAGAAKGLENYVYITVGTGIGGGVVIAGQSLHGEPHAEIGHMKVPLLDEFQGSCTFHHQCLEGLASGSAMQKRWGCKAQELPADHPAWELEAAYLAAMVQNLVSCFAPQKIILGGGVMEHPGLLPRVQELFLESSGGYWQGKENLLCAPLLGNMSGIIGALRIAQLAAS